MSQYFSSDTLSVYSKHMILQALLNTYKNKMMFKMTGKRLNLLLLQVFVYYYIRWSWSRRSSIFWLLLRVSIPDLLIHRTVVIHVRYRSFRTYIAFFLQHFNNVFVF